MSATPKDLNYYLSHTDEMPTDPKEIEALANAHMAAALESGSDQLTVDRFVDKDESAESSPAAKGEEAKPKEEPKAEEPKAEPKAEEKPEGILAKDGKNVIPYSQLESARQGKAAAEQRAGELQAEIDRLKAGQAKPAGEADVSVLTEDELNALEADSPTLARLLRAQQNTIQKLTGTVQSLAEHQQGRAAEEVAEIKSEIQTAIDANPTLASWQTAEDQAMWNKASAFDQVLRGLPEYKDVAFEDRFKKVVELTHAALGQEVEQPRAEAPNLTQEQIKAVAAAKLKAKPSLPRSLSDIPGGAPPVADERERVDQMSSVELGGKFLSMTREQLDSYLSNL